MAQATECQTHGTVYEINVVKTTRLEVIIDLPFELDLETDEEQLLRANVHNALELVLAPLFK